MKINRNMVKLGVGVAVSYGVDSLIGAVTAPFLVGKPLITRVTAVLAEACISGMVGEAAVRYATRQVDGICDAWVQFARKNSPEGGESYA